MATVNFRRIDVDALDPDNAPSEDVYPQFPPVSIQEVTQIGSEAKSALSKGNFSSSLKLLLGSPPYGGDAQTKVRLLFWLLATFWCDL
ncbi:hypothetical protein AWJ20_2514 [Sugiyamaella lignohabitans]|uniref:Actin-related protein 2/3 complex subunit 5 n=1 Tax=Sugiyamaella lignohabitans TaxID=796027 RepID=A0A161HGK2_9ASCO|nr:uncharacterized protein AWJ20_2514 [Sugiyamaella lignohabitans]ANB14900.1 hypothetical protein AWJ20_2514 [Sugiyamaella lignohabitans]